MAVKEEMGEIIDFKLITIDNLVYLGDKSIAIVDVERAD